MTRDGADKLAGDDADDDADAAEGEEEEGEEEGKEVVVGLTRGEAIVFMLKKERCRQIHCVWGGTGQRNTRTESAEKEERMKNNPVATIRGATRRRRRFKHESRCVMDDDDVVCVRFWNMHKHQHTVFLLCFFCAPRSTTHSRIFFLATFSKPALVCVCVSLAKKKKRADDTRSGEVEVERRRGKTGSNTTTIQCVCVCVCVWVGEMMMVKMMMWV